MDGDGVCDAAVADLGVRLCEQNVWNMSGQVMIPDSAGGTVIAWEENRGGMNWDIYAQRVNSSGNTMWPGCGVEICSDTSDQFAPVLTTDGASGAIMAWNDRRREGEFDVYAQRIDASGKALWKFDGVAVCLSEGYQRVDRSEGRPSHPPLVSDGSGGAIITWTSWEGPYSDPDIYAQRVWCNGWAGFDTVPSPEYSYVEWRNLEVLTNKAVVCPGGDGSWLYVNVRDKYNQPMDGVAVSRSFEGTCDICECEPLTVLTDAGGIATLPIHAGLDVSVDTACCVVTTKVSCKGVDFPWKGSACVVLDTRKWLSPDMHGDCTVDAADDLMIFHTDWLRHACRSDFFCDGIVNPLDYALFSVHYLHECDMIVGVAEGSAPVLAFRGLAQNYPNPFNPVCTIRYEIAEAGRVGLHVFDIVGKPVRTLVDAWREPGAYSEVWDGKADDGSALPSGVYFYRLEAGDFVATRKMVLIH